MRYFNVKIDNGNEQNSLYTIYYNSINPLYVATLRIGGGPATNISYTQLTAGNGVAVEVPDNITQLILYDQIEYCSPIYGVLPLNCVTSISTHNIPEPIDNCVFTATITETICTTIIPCNPVMDAIFVLDVTLSMLQPYLNGLQSAISNIANTIATESGSDYRLGLVIFDEYITTVNPTYYNTLFYQSLPISQRYTNINTLANTKQVITAMEMLNTNNITSFNEKLNMIGASIPLGDGLQPTEPSDIAVERIVNYNLTGTFRNGVTKLIILITDNYASGSDDFYNSSDDTFISELITACYNNNIKVLLMRPNSSYVNDALNNLAIKTNGMINNSFDPTISDGIINFIQNICI